MCEDTKTLAALQRQFVAAPDASNRADFLRISPWRAADVRASLRRRQVTWLLAEAAPQGLPRVDEYAVDWLTGALEMLGETGDMQLVLHHFLRQRAPTT